MAMALIGLTLALAFANGANDVSKGIATLVGGGLAKINRAVWWGAFWTAAGGAAAAFASQGLVAAFSGKGLLVDPTSGHAFLTSVAGGAVLWVVAASAAGLPVSTTHAMTGALCGAAVMAAGIQGIHWQAVAQKFAMPLLLGPLLSMALMAGLFPLIRHVCGSFKRYCVCVEQTQDGEILPAHGAAAVAVGGAAQEQLVIGKTLACSADPEVISRLNIMDGLHWMTAGLTSFVRGLNDAPKVLALGSAAAAVVGLSAPRFYILIAAAMGLGSLAWGFRVTETLSQKVTPMSPEEGFSANLITSVLVGLASRLALPVSTTHVSSGAIIGIGWRKGGGDIRWATVRDMFLAWVITLPVSALLAMAVYCVARRILPSPA